MSAALDRRAYAELTTSTVPTPEAFAYWREMICATFVRLAAEPLTAGRFSGRIEQIINAASGQDEPVKAGLTGSAFRAGPGHDLLPDVDMSHRAEHEPDFWASC